MDFLDNEKNSYNYVEKKKNKNNYSAYNYDLERQTYNIYDVPYKHSHEDVDLLYDFDEKKSYNSPLLKHDAEDDVKFIDILLDGAESHEVEYTASINTHEKYMWICLYFLMNLLFTIFTRSVYIYFPFPFILSSIHMIISIVGCLFLYSFRVFSFTSLSLNDHLTLGIAAILYSINVALGNIVLEVVPIFLRQTIWSFVPIVVLFFNYICFGVSCSRSSIFAILVTIVGIFFSTIYEDVNFSSIASLLTPSTFFNSGVFFTFIGLYFSATKTIITNHILVGRLKMSVPEFLLRICPLTMVQSIIYAYVRGEVCQAYDYFISIENISSDGRQFVSPFRLDGLQISLLLVLNGTIAFLLSLVVLMVNKKTGTISFTVAANTKQVLVMILSVIMFHLRISFVNAMGMIVTLFGAILYALNEIEPDFN